MTSFTQKMKFLVYLLFHQLDIVEVVKQELSLSKVNICILSMIELLSLKLMAKHIRILNLVWKS